MSNNCWPSPWTETERAPPPIWRSLISVRSPWSVNCFFTLPYHNDTDLMRKTTAKIDEDIFLIDRLIRVLEWSRLTSPAANACRSLSALVIVDCWLQRAAQTRPVIYYCVQLQGSTSGHLVSRAIDGACPAKQNWKKTQELVQTKVHFVHWWLMGFSFESGRNRQHEKAKSTISRNNTQKKRKIIQPH